MRGRSASGVNLEMEHFRKDVTYLERNVNFYSSTSARPIALQCRQMRPDVPPMQPLVYDDVEHGERDGVVCCLEGCVGRRGWLRWFKSQMPMVGRILCMELVSRKGWRRDVPCRTWVHRAQRKYASANAGIARCMCPLNCVYERLKKVSARR